MSTFAIYNPSWRMMGGGEKYIASIGAHLARNPANDVTLLADRDDLTPERLERVFGLDCSRMQIRPLAGQNPARFLGEADIAVVVSNFRRYRSRARKSILILQIPYPAITPRTITRRLLTGAWREGLKDLSRLSLLEDARRADLVLVYSSFVRDVLLRNHRVNARVLYPPIDDFGPAGRKANVILSVGRIFRGSYNDKRYDVLIDGFKTLRQTDGARDWEYHIVGNAGSDTASQRYLAELRSRAGDHPIRFFVNEPYERLRSHYAEASLFWHGAGYGVDESREPERTEHFGMTTVEAMSAGCIPLAVNNGGQREIVRHGECGFLWETTAELAAASASLISDTQLRSRMREGARQRYTEFDHEHFEKRLSDLLERL